MDVGSSEYNLIKNWITAVGLAMATAAFIIILLLAEWMQP